MQAGNSRSGRWLLAPLLVLAAGCGAAVATGSGGSTGYATKPSQPGRVNPAAVPLGDGYVSTVPRVGYVDSCLTHFGATGGARVNGPWINTASHTWDYRTKLHVNGAVRWPSAAYSAATRGGRRVIVFNSLPINHVTGVFPIQSSDPAYRYDQNANHIVAHSLSWSLPLSPPAATSAGCTGSGPVGVLSDGVVLYNALDGEGRDAGAHEVLDVCAGHPDPSSTYHHHDIPPCILNRVPPASTKLVGYALDGYGIYVTKDAKGRLPGNTQLDACHGTTSRVLWNGKLERIYHYVATLEYPYTVGCYHGTALSVGGPPGRPADRGPPAGSGPGPPGPGGP